MSKYASKVVEQAKAWLGKKESDGSHKVIIDTYNGHKPLARGYAVNWKSDPWCATFVSAVAIKLGYTDIIPTECSCSKMIDLFKKIGSWVENDAYKPNPGDIIFYDWDDNGKGDNVGSSDHVGIVEKFSGSTITIIEGNYSDSVKRRTLTVNGRYIRGYGIPKYDKEVVKPATTTSKVNSKVLEWQQSAIKDGFKFPKYGADGQWGAECESVAKKAICKKRLIYTNKNLTKIVQRIVGVTADGLFGKDTRNAVIAYQKKNGLVADGEVGINTWKKLLSV